MWKRVTVLVVAVCCLAQMARAQEDFGTDAAYGSLAVLANVFYMPAKVVYAAIGGLTGCLVYLVTIGNEGAAIATWSPSIGGTYVVTPAMLRGEEPVLFNGASYSVSD